MKAFALTHPSDADVSLPKGTTLPLIVTRRPSRVDAVPWALEHRDWIRAQTLHYGAVLFRAFGVGSADLREFVAALSDGIETFSEESSPRTAVAKDILTSTDYPHTFPIQFHNEFSYSARWPMKLVLCCLRPADSGGSTPIADSRQVLRHMSSVTRQRFERAGVLYRRNFFPYMGVKWQVAFSTQDPAVVTRYCKQNGIRALWEPDGTLRTEQVGHAIVKHPHTHEEVWFNHAFFFNIRALEPTEVRDVALAQPEFSTNTYFGDGTPIEPEVIEELREAYRHGSVELPWREGDVLFFDNMLVAHSRRPFVGQRRVVVCMAEPFERSRL